MSEEGVVHSTTQDLRGAVTYGSNAFDDPQAGLGMALDSGGAIHRMVFETSLGFYETGELVESETGLKVCMPVVIDGRDRVHLGLCKWVEDGIRFSHLVEDGMGGFIRTVVATTFRSSPMTWSSAPTALTLSISPMLAMKTE